MAHELTHVVQQGQRAAQPIVQKTGRGSRQSVDTYTVEQTMRLLDLAFSLVPSDLEDTEIPESQRRRIQLLYERLRTLYEQLEHAREIGDSRIVPGFDITPEDVHTTHGSAHYATGPLEGEAYGIEFYLAERNGDWDRRQTIRDLIFIRTTSIVMDSQVTSLHENFCSYYGAMRVLFFRITKLTERQHLIFDLLNIKESILTQITWRQILKNIRTFSRYSLIS